MSLLFNIIMLLLALFIIYWFWLSQAKSYKAKKQVVRIVAKEGVYSPANLSFDLNNEVKFEFFRDEQSACSEVVIFKELDKQFDLPCGKVLKINLGKLPKGSYHFSCQMNMYQGKIKVG